MDCYCHNVISQDTVAYWLMLPCVIVLVMVSNQLIEILQNALYDRDYSRHTVLKKYGFLLITRLL